MAKSGSKEAKQDSSEQSPTTAGAPQEGFLAHYATLQETARALREQTEPDLDALIPLVDRALAAYKGCKSRIEAVQSLLDQRLGDVETGALEEGLDEDDSDGHPELVP